MAVCHADQRYYQGKRDPKILNKKASNGNDSESCGTVISDPTGTYEVGQKVVMIPNQPPMQSDEEFYENYMTGTHFLSSGFDGFMREFVSLPKDRVVAYDAIEDTVAAITEFVSVGMHAMNRLLTLAHSKRGPNRRYRRWKFSICGCQYYQLYFARSRDCGYWSSLGEIRTLLFC